MITRAHFVLTVMVSFVLSSCTSTQLARTWRDTSYKAGPLKKILVVATGRDQERRSAWEDGLAAALSWHGVEATPSYRLISKVLPDSTIIDSVARAGNFDGIVLIGRSSTMTTESVTPSLDIISPGSPSGPWSEAYYEYYNRGYYPGYPVFNEFVNDEITLWTTRGRKRMIWSGVGEVHESGQGEDVSGEIISLFIKELIKQEVIAAAN